MENTKYLSIRPNLHVCNLMASVEFYNKIIGLDILHVDDSMGFALLAKQNSEIALLQQNSFTPTGVYLYVNSVEKLYLHIKKLDVKICSELTQHAHGTKDFVIRDPDGHQVAIGERI